MEENKEKKLTRSFYVVAFIVYCFIGWCYEVIWEAAIGHGFVNRGFLFGPYLPIYGFGVLILYFILRKLMKKEIKLGKVNITPVITFLAILVIASTIEYFSSYVMELLFHKRWWDYSYDLFNINGRVSLRNSLLLAIGGTLLICLVQPILDKTIGKLSKKKANISGAIIATIMVVDLIITIIGYVK
jgi:uncharacterized membrane protein